MGRLREGLLYRLNGDGDFMGSGRMKKPGFVVWGSVGVLEGGRREIWERQRQRWSGAISRKPGLALAETQCIGGRSPSGHRTKVSEMRIRVPLLTSAQVNSESILFIFIIIYIFFHQMWSEKVTGLSLELPVWLSWQRVGGSWPHAPNGRQLSKLLCGYQGCRNQITILTMHREERRLVHAFHF